jgi:hypothetical protein
MKELLRLKERQSFLLLTFNCNLIPASHFLTLVGSSSQLANHTGEWWFCSEYSFPGMPYSLSEKGCKRKKKGQTRQQLGVKTKKASAMCCSCNCEAHALLICGSVIGTQDR